MHVHMVNGPWTLPSHRPFFLPGDGSPPPLSPPPPRHTNYKPAANERNVGLDCQKLGGNHGLVH